VSTLWGWVFGPWNLGFYVTTAHEHYFIFRCIIKNLGYPVSFISLLHVPRITAGFGYRWI